MMASVFSPRDPVLLQHGARETPDMVSAHHCLSSPAAHLQSLFIENYRDS